MLNNFWRQVPSTDCLFRVYYNFGYSFQPKLLFMYGYLGILWPNRLKNSKGNWYINVIKHIPLPTALFQDLYIMDFQFGYPRKKLLQLRERQSCLWHSCIAYGNSCVKNIYIFGDKLISYICGVWNCATTNCFC